MNGYTIVNLKTNESLNKLKEIFENNEYLNKYKSLLSDENIVKFEIETIGWFINKKEPMDYLNIIKNQDIIRQVINNIGMVLSEKKHIIFNKNRIIFINVNEDGGIEVFSVPLLDNDLYDSVLKQEIKKI